MDKNISLEDFKERVKENIFKVLKIENFKIKFGKMIRSELVFLINNKIGENQIKTASIIEIIHNSSLIIDDIVDNEKERRNEKSLYTIIGDKKSYLFASYMIIKAIKESLMSKLETKIFLKVMERMTKSEIKQNKNYIGLCYHKTGGLFSSTILSRDEIYKNFPKKLYNILKMIGILYQIRDDITDNDSDMPLNYLKEKYNEYMDKIKYEIEKIEDEVLKNNIKVFLKRIFS